MADEGKGVFVFGDAVNRPDFPSVLHRGWMVMSRKYSPEMRVRALWLFAEARPSHPTMTGADRHVAGCCG